MPAKKNKKSAKKTKKTSKKKTQKSKKKTPKRKKKTVKKSSKKTPRKKAKKSTAGKEKLIGKITHYFSKIGVAVISLSGSLSVGDKIRIVGGEDTDFKQQVKSMEIEHKKIKKAKKGNEIGLKVKEKVREGYKVYKI